MPKHTAPTVSRLEAKATDLLDVDRLERAAMAEAPLPPQPVPAAVDFLADRLNRVEHMLGDLNGVIMRVGYTLTPVLTDGTYRDPDHEPVPAGELLEVDPTVDDRSALAKRISDLGLYADRLADVTGVLRDRLVAIDTAVEL